MPADAATIDALARRFAQLGRADRMAVLASLPEAERAGVLTTLAASERLRREENDAARQAGSRFAAYSPWLAKLAQAAEADTCEELTATAAAALRESHLAIAADAGSAPVGVLAQARRMLSQLLAPSRGGS
mgnify:CR=1 FL=1